MANIHLAINIRIASLQLFSVCANKIEFILEINIKSDTKSKKCTHSIADMYRQTKLQSLR